MNNLESFTDFHKRKRKDCIESLDSMYAEHYGGLEETEFVTDLIADLMHWAKANKLYDFNLYIERAKSYHNIEWKEDREEWNEKQEGEQLELELRDKNGHLSEDFISEDEQTFDNKLLLVQNRSMNIKKVNWYDEELDEFYDEDKDNKGYIYGIYLYDNEVENHTEVEWFKTEEERDREFDILNSKNIEIM